MLSNLDKVTEDSYFYNFTIIFFSYIVFIKLRVEEINPHDPTNIGSSLSCHLSFRELVSIT